MRIRGAGTGDAMVELGGHGPFARSPRFVVPPSPSCPASFVPQHLRVVSSCGEE